MTALRILRDLVAALIDLLVSAADLPPAPPASPPNPWPAEDIQ